MKRTVSLTGALNSIDLSMDWSRKYGKTMLNDAKTIIRSRFKLNDLLIAEDIRYNRSLLYNSLRPSEAYMRQ